MKNGLVCIILCLLTLSKLFAQYTVNGNAQQVSCRCYTLTNAQPTQSGSVWNNNKIDLSNSFDFVFEITLGNMDNPGADGMAFVLQPISSSVGSSGSGLGFQGIVPSIGITIDTYQNFSPDNDPSYDHIAIQRNGDLNHSSTNNLAGPVQASSTSANIEDGASHTLRISWDALAKTLNAYFDNVLRVSATNDLVNTTFGGNPLVFWGFTGSTGAEYNLQGFCTALIPSWNFAPTQTKCVNEPVQFFDNSVSFTAISKIYWDFGDGSNIDSVNVNPIHTYTAPGNYTVTQKVKAADGCEEINTQHIIIGSKPVPDFSYNDSCTLNNVQFTGAYANTFGNVNAWYWNLDNASPAATIQNPTAIYNTGGIKQIKLVVKTDLGCSSDTLIKPIKIYSRPQVDFTFTDSVCLGTATQFTGTITSADPVVYWNYTVDEAGTPSLSGINATYTFSIPGMHQVQFYASTISNTGCTGAVQKMVFVVNKPRPALQQFSGCQNTTVQLLDSSYTTDGLAITNWWWDLGNGQFSANQNPNTVYNTPGIKNIKLVVWNSKGCKSDTLFTTIQIAALPIAGFSAGGSSCSNTQISLTDTSKVTGGTIVAWSWSQGGTVFSTAQNPTVSFPQGTNTVELVVSSNAGCISLPATGSFVVKTTPQISMQFNDTCKWSPAYFTASEIITNIGITDWYWDFGDGSALENGNPLTHVYSANGSYTVKLYAISTEGCKTATLQKTITIYGTEAFAGNDTIAAPGQPIQLQASGGLSYEWSPSSGLSNTHIANPVAINMEDQTYFLRAFTPSGCESRDTMHIKIYKGPDIYMPNAFTPNEDGRNDLLRGKLIGMKSFDYLVIYNRYGQLVFRSTHPDKGWNGRYKFIDQPAGAYIWMASGTAFNGKKIIKKGTVLLLR